MQSSVKILKKLFRGILPIDTHLQKLTHHPTLYQSPRNRHHGQGQDREREEAR